MIVKLRLIAAFIACPVILGTNILAQSAWLPPTDRSSLSVEIYRLDRPTFRDNGTAMFITAQIIKASGLTFVLDLPIARSDEITPLGQSGLVQYSQSVIGNPYFGIFHKGNSPIAITYEAGIRIPMKYADKGFARDIGIRADFDRLEAFTADIISLRAMIGGYWSKDDNPRTGWIKGGGTLLISSEGGSEDLLIDLQSGLWYMGDVVIYGFNLNGRALVTGRDMSLSERFELLFGFGFMVNLGSFRPAVHGRYQISESELFNLGNNQNAVFGFSLSMFFGGDDY